MRIFKILLNWNVVISCPTNQLKPISSGFLMWPESDNPVHINFYDVARLETSLI